MNNLVKINGLTINKNESSNRIYEIVLKDEILDKLIFPFHKFDITALEYKPFTRFTLAKSLDDLTSNKFSNLINSILKERETGCFIIETNPENKKIPLVLLNARLTLKTQKRWMKIENFTKSIFLRILYSSSFNSPVDSFKSVLPSKTSK